MPPTQQPDAPSDGQGMAPEQDMSQQESQNGSVMISMPKEAFDAMHALVMQLASGLEQLKQGVEKQSGGGSMPPEEMPPAVMSGGAQGSKDDMDFLNGMAQEGSQK